MTSIMIPTMGDFDRLRKEAGQYADSYGLKFDHNGDADAFRHAYASAEMTRLYGEVFAKGSGDLWEVWGTVIHGPKPSETNMDLWNNARGREIGRLSTSKDDSARRARDAVFDGTLIRDNDSDDKRNRYYDDYKLLPPNPALGPLGYIIKNIDVLANAAYNAARSWTAPRDPLVLDLDSDGIEAIGINPAAPILFDMDGDGTKTATGWIKADDGIVVLDRNGNGLIDSGRELFGDSTVLTRGPRAGQTAANGYEALADLDINGDGVIDDQDIANVDLNIWRDSNQDGVSQADELQTLADAGIASISAVGQASNVNLGNGNTQPFSGSFTRTNGSTGAGGVAEVSGSLLLASNNFYREFNDNPVLTTAAQALPQMQGSGKVRDLR